jgi:hypothetical protein
MPQDKNLMKIDVIYSKSERAINNLVFHFDDATEKQFGQNDKKGRVESFVLMPGEHLIGAEIEHGKESVQAITFLTVVKTDPASAERRSAMVQKRV